MTQKPTSLDIQSGQGSILDIAQVFPMIEPRILDLARSSDVFLDIEGFPHSSPIDLSVDMIIRIGRYRTTETLDLALREIVDPSGMVEGLIAGVPRPRTLDVVYPLYIPYGSLDVRRVAYDLSATLTTDSKTYPDLYARTLPTGLIIRRAMLYLRDLWLRYRRSILIGSLALIVLSVPILSYVGYAISRGYDTLEDIRGIRDPSQITDMIRSARGDFERSSFLFAPFSWIPLDSLDTVHRASIGGLALTRGLDIIARTLPTTTERGSTVVRDDTDPLSYRSAARNISPLITLGIDKPTDWIVTHRSSLMQARDELVSAGEIYAGVRVTGDRTTRMQKIGLTISRIATLLDWSLKNEANILNMLGHTNPQRYIVFNQNRDEIRANGGFPGSILSLSFYKGNILDYRADDVYYYDWNLYPYKEIPPPGIALLTGNYGLRDVNYYPDFHETLEKANSFVERSGDASVGTALAIHQGLIEDILDLTGPITLSGVTIPFTSSNFSLLMSTLVENKYSQVNTPKDILFQFASELITEIQSQNLSLDILDILERYRRSGEILFASRDAEIDAFLAPYRKRLPWESSISPNWIYPVWTSVSGNKSDRYIDRSYQSTVRKIEGCQYENTITLTTKHTYTKTDTEVLESYFKQFNIASRDEQAKLRFIQGDGKNRAYVRVYVPLGSTLIGAGGDISTVSNDVSTVFSTLIETPVGTTTSKSWKYTLNLTSCDSYTGSVEWMRQPGLRNVTVK